MDCVCMTERFRMNGFQLMKAGWIRLPVFYRLMEFCLLRLMVCCLQILQATC